MCGQSGGELKEKDRQREREREGGRKRGRLGENELRYSKSMALLGLFSPGFVGTFSLSLQGKEL